MRALEKVGLVEREGSDEVPDAIADSSDVDALIARELAAAPVAPRVTELVLEMPAAPGEAISARSFESIFAEAAIPASPYPAEKMLRLLDGLKAMDVASRKMAVQAMDAADEAWTVDDAVLDAQRKMQALSAEKTRVATQAQQIVSQNQQLAQARDELQRSKVEALRIEIAELERAMATEIEQAGADKANCQAAGENARLAAQREETRLDAEIQRLGSLPGLFGSKN
ncbi:hypothetical protein GCM10027046_36660 [Uliginosibacterium flavum]|uniref:KfrA N-terminal DNA-binding domain-containing protein n=1 Tax=Uliginosibacterium flavum TaxID=1396831 RepID=A0ABV2TM79_9RHOO